MLTQTTSLQACLSSGQREAGRDETTCPRALAAQVPHVPIHPHDRDRRPGLQILHSCYYCVFYFNKGHCKTTMWWRANHTNKTQQVLFLASLIRCLRIEVTLPCLASVLVGHHTACEPGRGLGVYSPVPGRVNWSLQPNHFCDWCIQLTGWSC